MQTEGQVSCSLGDPITATKSSGPERRSETTVGLEFLITALVWVFISFQAPGDFLVFQAQECFCLFLVYFVHSFYVFIAAWGFKFSTLALVAVLLEAYSSQNMKLE
jgi:hypothetical protein